MIIRRLIRWALYLFIVAVVLLVAGVLLLNTIAREVMISRLRASTGMDVRIGQVDVGLLTPMVTIENLKLYNTADFGGSLFLDMPELHVEYDPFAFRSGRLHFKLVRLDLEELSLIQDKKGRLNVQSIDRKKRATTGDASPKPASAGINFTGIDTLNLTLGKFHMSNLASGRSEEIQFGIKNQIMHNVKSAADLAGLNILLAARAGAFTSSSNNVLDLGNLLKSLAGG